jgi:hypothetical protein
MKEGIVVKAIEHLLFFPRPTVAGRATYELVCISVLNIYEWKFIK